MWAWIVAILSGALMSVQGVFNTEVTKQSSIWTAAAFVQVTALIVCVLCWLFTGRDGSFGAVLRTTPKYFLIGGVIGAFITFTVIKSVASLGPAKAVMLIISAQLATSYLIELLGMFGTEQGRFEWKKLAGFLLIAVGVAIVQLTGDPK